MPNNEINIEAKVKYAERAKKQLDDLAKRSQSVGDSTKKGADKGADSLEKINREGTRSQGVFSKMAASVKGWAAGLIGVTTAVAAVTKAIRLQSEAMKEHAQIADTQTNKLIRLQYLGSYYKDRPQLRKQVAAYAEYGRRPFEEVAGAWYNLRSKAGSLSENQQQRIMMEALELGRTDPQMQLDTLVDMFSLYTKKTGATDINQVQNVLAATIKAAGAGGSEVARYMPQFLPIGMSGGLSAAQSAGLWSYATTLTSSPEMATTGLRAVFMGLQGKGSPQSAELLKSLGVSGGGFSDKISALSRLSASGRFGLAQAEQIAGREGASILLDLINNPAAMSRGIGQVTGANRGDIDTTAAMIDELLGSDPYAAASDELAVANVGIENSKGTDLRSIQWQARKRAWERRMRSEGRNEVDIWFQNMIMNAAGVLGAPLPVDPDQAPAEPYEITGPPVSPRRDPNSVNINNFVNDNSTHIHRTEGPDPYKGPRYNPHN